MLGKFYDFHVLIIPKIFRAVGKHDDAFWLKGLDCTRVVGNQDDSAGVGAQCVEDLFAGDRVKVVGGLVEKQDVRAGGHQGGQCEAGLFTAGECSCWLVELFAGEHEGAKEAAEALLVGVGAGFDGVLPDGFVGVDGVVFLGEVADFEAVSGDDAAFAVGAFDAGEEFEQGGFTCTVESEDDYAGAFVDG